MEQVLTQDEPLLVYIFTPEAFDILNYTFICILQASGLVVACAQHENKEEYSLVEGSGSLFKRGITLETKRCRRVN